MKISDGEFLMQESVKRMLTYLSTRAKAKGRKLDAEAPSTGRIFLYYVKMFSETIMEMAPDEIIAERNEQLKSDKLVVKLHHEEMANRFILHLSAKKQKSNTISTAMSAVRTFYDTNYVTLSDKAVIVPTGKAEKAVWLPEVPDLYRLVNKAVPRTAAYICCGKDTGIGIGDMLDLKWSTESIQYGTAKQQLKKGLCPIHIHFVRGKTGVVFDTFLGEDAIEQLNRYADFSRERLFPISDNQVRLDLKELDSRLRSHTLRKFFTTFVKMSLASVLSTRRMHDSAGISDAMVEYWSGHSLGKVRGAYNIPPVHSQLELYQEAYARIKLRKS